MILSRKHNVQSPAAVLFLVVVAIVVVVMVLLLVGLLVIAVEEISVVVGGCGSGGVALTQPLHPPHSYCTTNVC